MKRSHAARTTRLAATALAVAGLFSTWMITAIAGGTATAATGNPIIAENQKAGSDGWQLPATGFTVADDVKKQVKGFATTATVNPGQAVSFKVTTNPAATVKLDFYRLGYYGGLGGRLVTSGTATGVKQPACTFASATRTTDCSNWSTTYTLTTGTDWVSGVYVAVFTAGTYQSLAPFWVAQPNRDSDVLFLSALNTYQAYNAYPFDTTNPDAATSPHGYSLYDFNSANGTPASKVSFDRPFSAEYGGSGEGGLFDFEPMAIAFLEKNGYDVSYSNDIALDTDPSLLQRHKAVVIGGHAEYWTGKAYDGAIAARAKGVGLAFMSSNEIYWQVRYENNRRILVCYKHYDFDPVSDPSLKTFQWRELGRPEQTLIGVQFPFNGNQDWGGQPYVPTNTSHWAYAGTGMTSGKKVDGEIVGYEIDNLDPNFPKPPGTEYTILANSPFVNFQGASYTHNSSIYKATGGNYVWATGTMAWAWALAPGGSSDGTKDNVRPQMQIMTRNVLNKMIATAGGTGPSPSASASTSPSSSASPSPTASPTPSGPPGDPLISLNRPATASSEGGASYVAANAVDGNVATRWASVSKVDPQWIRIDLGASKHLSRVTLQWDLSCAPSYQIQVSPDGTTFTTAYSTTTGDGGTDEIALNAVGRYVRMFGTTRCRPTAGYSLQEFRAYGSAATADPLLSLNRPVVASSEGGSGYVARNAVDGSTATRWASISKVDPQWIRIDLGASKHVSKVTLTWDLSCAPTYEIQVSADGTSFTTAYSTTTGDGGVDTIALNATGRYVRMFGTSRCRPTAGYSLQEFSVYGH